MVIEFRRGLADDMLDHRAPHMFQRVYCRMCGDIASMDFRRSFGANFGTYVE